MKRFLVLASPGLLVVAPLAAWHALAPDSGALADASQGFVHVAAGAAALVGWRFGRSRIVAAAVAVALLDVLVVGRGDPTASALAALLAPPLLAVLAFLPDHRITARRAWPQLAAPLLVAMTAIIAHDFAPVHTHAFFSRSIVSNSVAWAELPQVALLGAALGTAAIVALAILRRRALEAGFAWCAVALVTAAATAAGGQESAGAWTLAAALCLGLAMIEASYALAYQDELTGLRGRRALNEMLSHVRAPAVIAVVDIDRFKSVNDRHGHDAGDQVLRMVASHLAGVGGGGHAFRSGGEEFTIVFPGCDLDDAMHHVELLRKRIATAPFTVRRPTRGEGRRSARKRGAKKPAAGRRLRVTISTGLAAVPAKGGPIEQVVRIADRALYRAKQNGRNRTEPATASR